MRYYIIAGERSGDLHGANLIHALSRQDSQLVVRGIGGGRMQESGVELFYHYQDVALMGLVEVLLQARKFLRLIRKTEQDILEFKPDAVIFIDFGGFNLRLAERLSVQTFQKTYYITPKVWAWNQKRAVKIGRYTDQRLVILPFEQAFFEEFGVTAAYVGNPVLDEVKDYQAYHSVVESAEKIIALVPGSRKQEVERLLPVMLDAVEGLDGFKVVISKVDNLEGGLYALAAEMGYELFEGSSYELLSKAHAALVTSGTATLETALFEVPQVVCYKASQLTYAIGSRLVKVDYISLPNLIAGEEIVPELIQSDCNGAEVKKQLIPLLENSDQRKKQLDGYKRLKASMYTEKSPSEEAAAAILQKLQA